jgi:hypothetical protein
MSTGSVSSSSRHADIAYADFSVGAGGLCSLELHAVAANVATARLASAYWLSLLMIPGNERAPNADAGALSVSNSQTGKWVEEGPMTIVADHVELLGRDVAEWGMGVFAPVLPAGIISIPATVAP